MTSVFIVVRMATEVIVVRMATEVIVVQKNKFVLKSSDFN
jgi:hypothetical protein